MASMEFKYARIKWRLKGTHVMSFGKKAKWLGSGWGVVGEWLGSGCTTTCVVAQWTRLDMHYFLIYPSLLWDRTCFFLRYNLPSMVVINNIIY